MSKVFWGSLCLWVLDFCGVAQCFWGLGSWVWHIGFRCSWFGFCSQVLRFFEALGQLSEGGCFRFLSGCHVWASGSRFGVDGLKGGPWKFII